MMRSPLLIGFFTVGCTCSPQRVDCSTPEKCAGPACVNSGCRFDDAGKALPTVRLGAKPDPIPVVKPVTIQLGETKTTSLSASLPKSVSGCTRDGLGAIYHLTVSEPTRVNVQVQGKEQLALGVLAHDDFNAEFLHCERGYDPAVQGLQLSAGKWVIVVSGLGDVQLKVVREMPPALVTLNPGGGGRPTNIAMGKPIKVGIGSTEATPSQGRCNGEPSYVYTGGLILAERGELTSSIPMGASNVVIGVAFGRGETVVLYPRNKPQSRFDSA